MGGFAWVTLATNDSYSLGALVLAHSLKAVGTVHQLAVLVTPGVTSAMREKLAAVFNLVQDVNILDSRDETNLRLLKRPELGITFTKLHCWRLTQYEKCVFLDADTLVLQYCDELFEREELSAAPDVGWPDCFNSGVFVYSPSLETYEKLIQFALEKGSFDGGDQGLLNLYFSDWAHKDISKHLPFIYNMCSTACYSYLPAFKQFGANAKIIHFIGPQKPWLQYFNTESRRVQPSAESSHLEEVLQRWWDIFCSLIHPHLSPAMPQGQLQHAVSPSYFPPQYAPPPNPTSSADDYENAWDPWDEYDKKIAQSSHYTSVSTHIQNQPIESLNTNASHVADQPTVRSQPQSHNYNTNSAQNNSFYQAIPQPAYQHVPRVPTPPPSTQLQYNYQEPPYDHFQSQYYHPEPQHRHSEPQYHHHEPQYHQQETPKHQSQPHFHHQEHRHPPDLQEHQAEPHQHTYHHQHDHQHVQEHSQQNSPSHHQPHYEHFQHSDNHQHTHHSSEQIYHQNDYLHTHEAKAESFSLTPDRPRSPNRPDPMPILPKECEATTTVSNDMSLSCTIEDSSNQDDAGLAGAFAQLTLGVPRTEEQDAFENLLRKQAWEVGNIDYLGKDSFDNIWSKITETLKAAPLEPPTLVPELEPEPLAPVQSQSQTARQEEAKSPQIPVTSAASPSDDISISTDDLKIGSEPTEAPNIEVSTESKPQVEEITTSTVSKEPQPLPEVPLAPKETEPIAEPAVPEKEETKELETKVVQPQTEVPKENLELQTTVPVTETKTQEPLTGVPAVEPKASKPQTVASEAETKAAAPEPPKETETVVEASLLPDKKAPSKDSEAQIIAPKLQAVKETTSGQEESKEIPKGQKDPKKTPQLQTSKTATLSTTSEPEVLSQPAEVRQQPEASLEKSERSALLPESDVAPAASQTIAASTKEEIKPAPKETLAAESTAASTQSSVPSKATPSKGSPKTKVTEATPPATPTSPIAEKTKESLAAEASIPETPPPSEGGSTPAPPPRKTDKPKKVAAKPKK